MKIDFNNLGLTDYSKNEPFTDKLDRIWSGAKTAASSAGPFIKEIDIPSVLKAFISEKVFTPDYVREIAKDTYLLRTDMLFNSFLFVGSEKALLVDTGFGITGLKKMIREITDKPLVVAVTHGHIGCVGGAGDFDSVKIHKDDMKLAKFSDNRLLHKAIFLLSPSRYYHKYDSGNLVSGKPKFSAFTKRELKSGISLGNRTIDVINIPSHTKGSVVFVDKTTGIAVSGDIVAPLGITFLPGACDLAKYSKNLDSFMNIVEERTIFCSYLKTPLDHRKVNAFKNLVAHTAYDENDYSKLISMKKSSEYLQFLIYCPAKTNRKSLIEIFRK